MTRITVRCGHCRRPMPGPHRGDCDRPSNRHRLRRVADGTTITIDPAAVPTVPMPWARDDGGRKAAGFKGNAPGDCVTRAIAIATGLPYLTVYDALNRLAEAERPRGRKRRSSSRTGVHSKTARRYLEELGWTFTPTMGIGTGCRVHLTPGELPAGRLVVSLSRHWCAVVDGTTRDLYDPSRDGTRCVYGYFTKGN